MRIKNERPIRHIPDNSKSLENRDLIPLSRALEFLSEWHNRAYTLEDFQMEVDKSSDHLTPLFSYDGKGLEFNPDILTQSVYPPHDEPTEKEYELYFKLWLTSDQDIVTRYGWFSLDMAGIKGMAMGNLAKFTEYLANPTTKIKPKAIRQALRINGSSIICADRAFFPIGINDGLGVESIRSINAKPNFSIGLYDWYIPLEQIYHLHPNYEHIYQVGKYYYILEYPNGAKTPTPKKVNLKDYDKRFYSLCSTTLFAPRPIQSLAGETHKPAHGQSKPINPTSIGHNAKANDRRTTAQNLAKSIWDNDDPNQLIRVGDMVYILSQVIPELANTSERTIKRYFRDIKPEYASKKGQSKVNNVDHRNKIIQKYKK